MRFRDLQVLARIAAMLCTLGICLAVIPAGAQDPTTQPTSNLTFKPRGGAVFGFRFTGAEPSKRAVWFGCDPDQRVVSCLAPGVDLCVQSCLRDTSCVAWSSQSQDPFAGRIEVRTSMRCFHYSAVPPTVSRQIPSTHDEQAFDCAYPGASRECAVGVVTERLR
jgi:hypothetical protein